MPTAAASEAERLALLNRLSQTFNSSLDLDEVLNRVMDEVIAITRAERGFVMLYGPSGELVFRVARGMDRSLIDQPQFQISRGVVERVARDGSAVLTGDAQHDDRFRGRHSVLDLRLRSILCVPLKLPDRNLGVLYVDNRLKTGLFQQEDLELLSAIASTAAIAIENARLYALAVEKGRLERELQVARELQASLLPRDMPEVPAWDLAATWLPARQISGDYYDWFPVSGGQTCLIIADVCDKGMPSALFMALSRSIVRASLDGSRSPAEGVARANRLICADSSGGMFITLFCALIEPNGGRLTYVNAGHNPPLLCWPDSGVDRLALVPLRRTGMALGVVDGAAYEERTLHLEPGDWVLLYTDGVIDARDVRGRAFGLARLERTLLDHRGASARQVVAAVEREVRDFTGSAPLFDDVTLLMARRK